MFDEFDKIDIGSLSDEKNNVGPKTIDIFSYDILFVSAKLQTKSKNGKIRAKTSRFISGKAESKLEILEIQAASSKSSSIHTRM